MQPEILRGPQGEEGTEELPPHMSPQVSKGAKEQKRVPVRREKHLRLHPKTNDIWWNKANRFIIRSWRANVDVSPVTSRGALVGYLCKLHP